MGDVPVAATANVAACPAVTVWLAGCDVIVGATATLDFDVSVKFTGMLIREFVSSTIVTTTSPL
jgi:hypothetical protein